jgi:hypothetical protein
MYYFKEGWEPSVRVQMDEAEVKKLLVSMLSPQTAEPLTPSLSAQASHIGQYIEHMMNDLGYSLLDLTITKDGHGDIIFEVINKEKET